MRPRYWGQPTLLNRLACNKSHGLPEVLKGTSLSNASAAMRIHKVLWTIVYARQSPSGTITGGRKQTRSDWCLYAEQRLARELYCQLCG